jgi:signal transduction histidine kinase
VPNQSRTFREIFRASDSLATESFRLLSARVRAGVDPGPLEEFLIALNRELTETLGGEAGEDIERARQLLLALLDANPGLVLAVLEGLLNDLQLRYQDPLVAVVFEAAGEVRPLLSLIADVVERESQSVDCRARAVEAFVTRSPGGLGVGDLEFAAQAMLQYLNAVLDALGKGTVGDFTDWHVRWVQGLKGIHRLLLQEEALRFDAVSRTSMDDGPDGAPTWGEGHVVLEAVGDALEMLASAPTRETVRIVLRILRANSPLPPWHAVPVGRAERLGGAASAESGRKILALVVDKTIQVVFGMASTRWWSEVGRPRTNPARRDIVLSPFDQPILEWTLLDSTQAPRTRSEAAGLLRVLAASLPSTRPSPRVQVYTELFLSSYQGGAAAVTPRGLPTVDSPARLDVLLDALDDTCRWIRNAACEACWSLALEHPAWFQPRHYTRLLPCLSDDDRAVRVSVMKAFQALAGYRSQRVATVVDSMSARLDGDAGDEEEKSARRDLEIALGITLDRLVDDVEQLQQEVQGLEARRRDLLDLMEKQATRVGEEIHHEVLNALGGYLATAIDEENYPEAKRRLDDLVAELRRIMNNLYPVDLETEGFLQAIRNRLRSARVYIERRRPGCSAELDCSPDFTDEVIVEHVGGGRPHLVLLYRIVQEAISNARKHSGGTRIEVRVRATAPGVIDIAIIDNGCGKSGSFTENVGMALMRQRAEEIGATIRYVASPGGGTTVTIRLAKPDASNAQGDERHLRGVSAPR